MASHQPPAVPQTLQDALVQMRALTLQVQQLQTQLTVAVGTVEQQLRSNGGGGGDSNNSFSYDVRRPSQDPFSAPVVPSIGFYGGQQGGGLYPPGEWMANGGGMMPKGRATPRRLSIAQRQIMMSSPSGVAQQQLLNNFLSGSAEAGSAGFMGRQHLDLLNELPALPDEAIEKVLSHNSLNEPEEHSGHKHGKGGGLWRRSSQETSMSGQLKPMTKRHLLSSSVTSLRNVINKVKSGGKDDAAAATSGSDLPGYDIGGRERTGSFGAGTSHGGLPRISDRQSIAESNDDEDIDDENMTAGEQQPVAHSVIAKPWQVGLTARRKSQPYAEEEQPVIHHVPAKKWEIKEDVAPQIVDLEAGEMKVTQPDPSLDPSFIPIKHRPRKHLRPKKEQETIVSSIAASTKRAIVTTWTYYCTIPRYNEFLIPYPYKEMLDLYKVALEAPRKSWLWHPLCLARALWDVLMALVLIFAVVFIPFVLAFINYGNHLADASIALTVIFVADLIVNALISHRTSHGRTGVAKLAPIWKFLHYATDIVSTIPWDFMVSGQYGECMTMLRLLRIPQLFRIFSSNPLLRRLSTRCQKFLGVGESFSTLCVYMGGLALYFHVFSCTVLLLGKVHHFEGWHEVEYVAEKTVPEQYTFGFFVAAFHAHALKPKNIDEQWNIMLSAIISAAMHGAVLGSISSLMSSLDPMGRMYKHKIEEVNEYMKYKNVDPALRDRVNEFFHLKYRGKYFKERELLGELNDNLRQEILVNNCRELVGKVSFLSRKMDDGRDEIFLGRIASALKAVYYLTGDIIFEQGKVGNEMFFIISGSVDVIINTKVVGTLNSGQFFGEVALLAQTARTATIQAQTNVVAYQLDGSDFDEIVEDFDDMAVNIRRVYEERVAKIYASQGKPPPLVVGAHGKPPMQQPPVPVDHDTATRWSAAKQAAAAASSRAILRTEAMAEKDNNSSGNIRDSDRSQK
ncbi:uncharacterized protein EV422DRAFT_596928 [Fimicolochytrium jonesii]|uniref:uncharacterized protein n=1 Tax=Fimicolochytrium jonesii TaxID=1396493 RepID=UPI0022FDB5EB|nr:uncharacterized protein EV422DRAFT_596928 [Fimicolochytrium jonesii]KAI8820100.1 hypothetical protein EV422DRAFT_596928 [Fimicolochytrium jonesii]